MKINRRDFLKSSVLSAAAMAAPLSILSNAQAADEKTPAAPPASGSGDPVIIDTNVHLSSWPFRHLKYSQTTALVSKLRHHRVEKAWACSFDALLHKNMADVNERLVEECRVNGEGLLVPFGGVNPMWPGWREHLRRCHEVHRMPGIRLHPSYQGYTLEHPEFASLLHEAVERGLIVQIALEMEDQRVQHPLLSAPPVNPSPLVALLKDMPQARVQLLNCFSEMRIPRARPLFQMPNVSFDIACLEGTGAVGRVIDGTLSSNWFSGVAVLREKLKVPLERLLFGSHAPFFPVENALFKLFESPLTLPQLQALMSGNARRMMGEA